MFSLSFFSVHVLCAMHRNNDVILPSVYIIICFMSVISRFSPRVRLMFDATNQFFYRCYQWVFFHFKRSWTISTEVERYYSNLIGLSVGNFDFFSTLLYSYIKCVMKSLFVEIKPEKCSFFTQGEGGGGVETYNKHPEWKRRKKHKWNIKNHSTFVWSTFQEFFKCEKCVWHELNKCLIHFHPHTFHSIEHE